MLSVTSCDSADETPSEDVAVDTVADVQTDGSGDDVDAAADVAPEDDVAEDDVDAVDDDVEDGADDAGSEDAPDATPPAFERTYTEATTHVAPDGHVWARSIVHLHSTHSHDACDGEPRTEEGEYNIACLHSLRDALCEVRIDVAWLTDHPVHMSEVDSFVDLLLHVPETDTLLLDDEERPYANWMTCENGHRTLVRVGAETAALMPVGLHAHLEGDAEERRAAINEYTPEAAAEMRAQGALVWVAHTEGRTVEDLRRVGVDGLEIYQLHANIDPGIREEFLGLEPAGAITSLGPMLVGRSQVQPDLAFIVFAGENTPSLNIWGTLLKEGPMVGTAGTDAHENTFPIEMIDDERLDSYRRMMSWFSNYVLVEGELTPEASQQALGEGRVMVVFDVLGLADGLDFSMDVDGTRFEMGSSPPAGESVVLRGNVPTPVGQTGLEAPVRTLVFRMGETEWEQAAEFGAGAFEFAVTEPGVYRVEVRTTANHLAPYMAELAEHADREIAWVMTNAWRVGLDGL